MTLSSTRGPTAYLCRTEVPSAVQTTVFVVLEGVNGRIFIYSHLYGYLVIDLWTFTIWLKQIISSKRLKKFATCRGIVAMELLGAGPFTNSKQRGHPEIAGSQLDSPQNGCGSKVSHQEFDRRFWSLFPCARVPFGYLFLTRTQMK